MCNFKFFIDFVLNVNKTEILIGRDREYWNKIKQTENFRPTFCDIASTQMAVLLYVLAYVVALSIEI